MPIRRSKLGGSTKTTSLRTRWLVSFSVTVLAFVPAFISASAQVPSGPYTRPLITESIDEGKLITLNGNTHPEANSANDRGPVADDFPMQHLLLQLKRSPEQELALQKFIEELHTQGSPKFHQWLTAQEFGDTFGLAQSLQERRSCWRRLWARDEWTLESPRYSRQGRRSNERRSSQPD